MPKIKILNQNLRIFAEGDVDTSTYHWGTSQITTQRRRVEITDHLDARTAEEAMIFADMLDITSRRLLRYEGTPIDNTSKTTSAPAGCSMVIFCDAEDGREAVRVAMTHESGRSVVAYGRTIAGAISSASDTMTKLLQS